VFVGVNEVVCVDVEGRAVLSDGWDKPMCSARTGICIANIEMAMRCRGRGVVGMEVGVVVKCCGVQGCCVGVRQGVRPCQSMVQVAVKEKIDRVGAAAHPQRGWRKTVALVGLLACVTVGKERPPARAFSGRGEVVEVEKGHGHGQW